MTDDDQAAAELHEGIFEGAQGVDIQVVGGLIEDDQVGAAFEQAGQVHAVALATGQRAHFALLLVALEVEARAIGAAVDLGAAEVQFIGAFGDVFPDRFFGVQVITALIDVGHLHRLADDQLATVGRFLARDHVHQRRLAGAVGANHADDATARQLEVQVVKQQFVAVGLFHVLGLDHHVAQALTGRDADLGRAGLHIAILADEILIGRNAGLGFFLTGLRRSIDPLELALQDLHALAFGAVLFDQFLLFLLQPAGVVSFPGQALALLQFQDPAGDIVQEVAIMGDQHHGAFVFAQMAFEPGHGLGIEMFGGLIEQQQVGFLEQQFAQGHAANLATGQCGHVRVPGRAAQRVHGDVQGTVQLPAIGGIDHVLELAHLFHELVHLVVVDGFAHFHADLVESV